MVWNAVEESLKRREFCKGSVYCMECSGEKYEL
jgi:hypothetical protein